MISHRILEYWKREKNEQGAIRHQKYLICLLFLNQLRQDLEKLKINKGFAKWERINTDRKRVPDTAAELAFCEKFTFTESLVNLCSTKGTVISKKKKKKKNTAAVSRGGTLMLSYIHSFMDQSLFMLIFV